MLIKMCIIILLTMLFSYEIKTFIKNRKSANFFKELQLVELKVLEEEIERLKTSQPETAKTSTIHTEKTDRIVRIIVLRKEYDNTLRKIQSDTAIVRVKLLFFCLCGLGLLGYTIFTVLPFFD